MIIPILLSLVTITRPVDGDTVKTARGYVRLLGVDAPETVKPKTPVQVCGPEASAALKAALPAGTKVRLTYGPRRRDKYGRRLAYVWLGPRLINREMIESGLAHALTAY